MSPIAAQMTQDEACSYAMAAMASGSVPFMVLKAIVELDVFEIIKRAGPGAHLSPYEIAAQLPTKNPDAASMLDRMLQVLASYSVFSCEIKTQLDGRVDRAYGLAPVCKYFTKNEDGVSFSALALMHQDRVFMESWYYLKDAVLDGGIAFNKAHGKAVFEYIGTDPRFNKVFNNAMSNHSTIIMKRILETYKGFEGLSTLVDVGGGTGAILNMIISKYPTIKGINFDLPHVIADAPQYDGVEHVGGDMFVSVPKGDAIFMKWICHSWTDEYCLKFLKTCHAALPDHGKVIVCEFILPVAPETTHSAKTQFILDAIMLAHCAGGKERTQPEYERLAKEAGFKGFRIACSAYDIKIIEFLKMDDGGSVTTQLPEDELCSYAMTIAAGSIPPMVLKAVVELDVLEIIKKAGVGAYLSPEEIAAQLPTKNPDAASMLDRMLRLLASYCVLSFSLQTLPDGRVQRLYGLAPVCEFLTKNDDGVSLGAISLTVQDKILMESWYYLKDAVLDGGIPFNKAYGKAVFEYIGTDPRFNNIFNNGMSNHSTIIMKRMLKTYKGFEGVSTLVDVGGGTGATLNMIISKHPTIKGINFDLPHVTDVAPTYTGVEHIGGDMFVSVPKGDAMFMKWICHSWTDEQCVKFLKNCYASLPEDGKVIVCEYILPTAPETSYGSRTMFQCDALMLAHNTGGKERTKREYEDLAKRAGFKGLTISCAAYDTKIMEFLK